MAVISFEVIVVLPLVFLGMTRLDSVANGHSLAAAQEDPCVFSFSMATRPSSLSPQAGKARVSLQFASVAIARVAALMLVKAAKAQATSTLNAVDHCNHSRMSLDVERAL